MRNLFLSFTSAILVVLAAPPVDWWVFGLISLIPIYLVIKNETPLRAAGYAGLMGFFMLVGGTYWWVDLLGRFADMSMPASLGLFVLFCAYQAIPYLIWGGLCSMLHQRYKVSWLISGPLVIGLAEMIVPFFFKMYLGLTLWKAWPLIQVAELGGPAAVSALLVLINIVLAESILTFIDQRRFDRAVKVGAAIIVMVVLIGWARAGYIVSVRDEFPAIRVGILQPNFGIVSIEERKHRGEKYIQTLRKATQELGKEDVDLIVWPETAWPFLFDRQMTREYPQTHPWALRPGVRGRLMFGTLSHTFGGKDIYNSAVLLADDGRISSRYDKTKLVPFGEYIPFAERFPDWAEDVREQTPLWPDIIRGEKPQLLIDNDLRIGPLICSEDIDMRNVHRIARDKPNLLVTIASDAWFGDSGGAWQHMALSAFRAVETRKDLVRATNTGVSAIIDASGRLRLAGPLVDVPDDQPKPPTLLIGEVKLMDTCGLGPYAIRFFPLACLLGLIAGVVVARKK